MYSIFTYIWAIYGVNDGKYSIHGAYGLWTMVPDKRGTIALYGAQSTGFNESFMAQNGKKSNCRDFHARVTAELVQRGQEWRIKQNWLVGSSCYGKNDGFL